VRIENITEVRPGDVVARAIYDDLGQVLLNAGVVLTAKYIRALEMKGYTLLYIKDAEEALDVVTDEDISPLCRARATMVLTEAFDRIGDTVNEIREVSKKDFKDAFASDAIRDLIGLHGPLAMIHKVVSQILDEVLTRPRLAGLTSIRSVDGALYHHSIDVCIVSIMIGRTVGLSNTRLTQLAAGCLLHDIGRIFIDPSADEPRMIREHTKLGYDLLRNSPDPDILAPYVALEHHERQDGTGLPRGLVGSNLIERKALPDAPVPTIVGEIAAIANAYDTLMTGSDKASVKTPDEAVKTIYERAGSWYNKALVDAFLHVVPVFPVGMEVTVTGAPYQNFTGIVTKIDQAHLDRPVVTLIFDANGQRIRPETIDLVDEPKLRVRCGGRIRLK